MIENWASSLPGVEDRTGASEADRSYNFNSDFPKGGGAETASKDNNLGPSQSVGVFERISACSAPSAVCSCICCCIFMSACFA